MKIFIISLLFLLHSPVRPHESNEYSYNNDKCFRTIYKEKYIPGDSLNPGYVESWEEYLNIPCPSNQIKKTAEIEKNISKVKTKKCNDTLGALVGGGVAASLSAVDAYGWSIPLGLVLGKGIANSEC
jgi:hypothetical protein